MLFSSSFLQMLYRIYIMEASISAYVYSLLTDLPETQILKKKKFCFILLDPNFVTPKGCQWLYKKQDLPFDIYDLNL